jgi:hypothetical protein
MTSELYFGNLKLLKVHIFQIATIAINKLDIIIGCKISQLK